MKRTPLPAFIFILPLLFTDYGHSDSVSLDEHREELPLDRALKAIHMRRSDLAIVTDLSALDEAPALLRQGLSNPLHVISVPDSVVQGIEGNASSIFALKSLADLIDIRTAGRLPYISTASAPDAARRLYAACGSRLNGIEEQSWKTTFDDLPRPIGRAVGTLLTGLIASRIEVEKGLENITEEERKILARAGKMIRGQVEEYEARRIVNIASKVDEVRMVAAAQYLLAGIQGVGALPTKFMSSGESANPIIDGVSGDVVASFETPAGAVIVGGPGPTVYRRPAAIILDLGGDDEYRGWTGSSLGGKLKASVCVDLSGDDIYASEGDFSQGTGWMGAGVLVDMAGNDQYISQGGLCQGCGVLGVGMLVDLKGDDRYEAGIGAQGAGIFGLGLLIDGDGQDRYQAGGAAQGYGGTRGAGGLFDRGGDDTYFAGGMLPDFREEGRFRSLAQGFGTGIRPFAVGGVGLLVDLLGDDRYEGDYFTQGSAYWMGLGLLMDREGRDVYIARRYSQGSGVHLAIGGLMDKGGDDIYRSWGVSQGCGHDLAVGLILDESGDDSYESTWLSQGSGNANGVGFLVDGAGNDRYTGDDEVQGSGVGSRGFGSIGVLLDGGGDDRYSGFGRDGEIWTNGEYGVGLDDTTSVLW